MLSVEEVAGEEGLEAMVGEEGVVLLVDRLIGQRTQAPFFGSECQITGPIG